MDIQMVGSAFGGAKYVCSYICKPECDEVNQSVREAVSNLPSNASTKKSGEILVPDYRMQEDSIKHSRQKSSLKQQNTAYHRSIV
jgi:hypothetical protein